MYIVMCHYKYALALSTLLSWLTVSYSNRKVENNEKQDQTLLWACVTDAHLQCVNSRYAKLNIQECNQIIPKLHNVIYSM